MRIGIALLFTGLAQFCHAGVVATWLFDEQTQAYPSTVLSDAGPNQYVIALGRGARLVPGRFGNALEIAEPEKLEIRGKSVKPGAEGAIRFGLVPVPTPTGRKVQPLWWGNATFAVLMTSGEKHLRTPGYANATKTKLNLGAFDWTVEFWYQPASGTTGGVVFELGSGPRGENDQVTRLSLDAGRQAFELVNQPSGTTLKIPTDKQALAGGAWRHLAFVYAAGEGQLRHYVDGKLQTLPANAKLAVLPHGDEAYFTIGRDGLWARPLAGKIDEMRFSDNRVYTAAFTPPAGFSILYGGKMPKVTLKAGPPLLFGKTVPAQRVIDLGSRKHVFIDDAMVAKFEGITWAPNPPKRMEKVADEVRGHLTMVEDETGLLRLYYRGPDDYLAVMTSRDGVHWEKPDTGHGVIKGERNIVLPQPVGLGCVLIDPNGPPETRYKYVSGTRYRSLYLFTSKDGFWFEQSETAVLPFAAGSQSALYYDDQRQVYVAHHRSDYGETPGGTTQRRFVMSEVKNLFEPWPF
ncbi:MAG TPA: LamG domain-containing protein, partial [Candidatus Solibacter sp.]|nr:LamG domain-containing protein [Candidatus Solibacter sp.]